MKKRVWYKDKRLLAIPILLGIIAFISFDLFLFLIALLLFLPIYALPLLAVIIVINLVILFLKALFKD